MVLVTRNTVAAAWSATRAVTLLHSHAVPIAALVIVSDGAGPEPRDATARFSMLEGRAGGVVRVPFAPALRLVDHIRAVTPPDKVLAAVAQIRALVHARPR